MRGESVTQNHLEKFNRAVYLLYYRDYCYCTIAALAGRFGITTQRTGQILIESRKNMKIIEAAAAMNQEKKLATDSL